MQACHYLHCRGELPLFAFQAAFAGVVDRDDLCKDRPSRADAGVAGGGLQRAVQARFRKPAYWL